MMEEVQGSPGTGDKRVGTGYWVDAVRRFPSEDDSIVTFY